jgi:polyisoprenoid-binding protein YceI
MTTTTLASVPGLVAGTWVIDPSHSEISFSVRHLMVSKVRGTFSRFAGEIVVADDLLASSVSATIDASSIDTRDESRDNHLRTNDFFDIENHPEWSFVSKAIRAGGKGGFLVDGDLTLRGVTKTVTLDLELAGVNKDPWGNTKVAFSANTEINRKDFGVEWNAPLEAGGVLVGENVTITLEIQAALQA